MAGRNRYKEKLANTLYEKTALDKTFFELQASWREAEQTLSSFEKQFHQKLSANREEKREENKKNFRRNP